MQEARDPTLPPDLNVLPYASSSEEETSSTSAPSELLPPGSIPPQPASEKQRRDSRAQLPSKELLKKGSTRDSITPPPPPPLGAIEHQVDHASILRRMSLSPEPTAIQAAVQANIAVSVEDPNAFSRFLALGQKPKSALLHLQELESLVIVRDSVKLSQKQELKLACDQYNQKAKEIALVAFQIIKNSLGVEMVLEEAYSLLDKVLTNDRYEENDAYLFELFTKDQIVEEAICRKLIQFLEEAVKKANASTLFRLDSGWQQKLLRVMHNGYLSGVFIRLDKEIKSIRKSKFLEHEKGAKILHVKEAGKEALECIHCVRKSLDKLPPNLIRLYSFVYTTVREKFGDVLFADAQLAQFVFLRAINPRISMVHEIDRYLIVEQKILDKQRYKNEQCLVITKIIQSALGFIKSQEIGKEDQIMTLKDPKSGATLLDFILVPDNFQVVLAFIKDLKARLRVP